MDELIKRLREHGEFLIVSDRMKAPPNVNVRNVFAEDYAQAADAIEQLSNAGSAYGRGWTLGYDAGRAESKPRWISVKERLPEAGERVLCYCRANIYEVMKMRTDGDWVYDTNHIYMHGFVTHWMPLPKGPAEE